MTGTRSLFHYEKLGYDLQDFLAAHGYEVISIPLPFRNSQLRKKAFHQWLTINRGNSFHFFMGPETHCEFKQELATYADSTLTVIGKDSEFTGFHFRRAPLSYQLHKLFCRLSSVKAEDYANTLPLQKLEDYDRFLDHCVQLAEDEVIGEPQ